MFATEGTWREAERPVESGRAFVDLALVASLAMMLAIGAFLMVRRATGAFESPLPAVPLIVTATGLLAWATAVRVHWRNHVSGWLLAAVLVLFAIGCSYPGVRTIDWLVWLPMCLALGLIPARRSSPAIDSDRATGQMLQEFTRARSADGVETIRGTLVAEFLPGDRLAILHIAFCPPFERLPTVRAARTAGPTCDVKIAQILHQGARLEVRLARASTTARRATIEFSASALAATLR
jgi:hypothetical protein